MKLKIDTQAKTIQVENQCKLVELFDFVKKIFPDNQWKEYSIEAVPIILNWNNPICIPIPYYTYPAYQPVPTWQNPFVITCGNAETTFCLQTN